MVGLNVTRRTGFCQEDIARLRASGRKVAGVIADLMAFYLERQREHRELNIAPMHDVCAIASYVDASLIDYRDARVDIELKGSLTRGMTVCDFSPAVRAGVENRPRPNAKVAVDAKSRPLIDRVTETLLAYA
jgi:pyrimidine-specific ribonucleoside hydrolase